MTLAKYLQEMTLQHRRPNTIKNARLILSALDRFKPLNECTADDLKQYVQEYIKKFKLGHNGRSPQEGNLNTAYTIFKKYYNWAGKPEVIAWIKTKNVLKKINPNKLLTPAEIQTMLRVWDNSRDKCMLAIAYESGMRIGELLSLRVEDITIKEGECMVRVPDNYEGEDINAKTGSRSLVLIESLPYIEKYLLVHNGTSRLFEVHHVRAHYILKNMATKAGITKNVHWHLLRHTRATEMAKLGMQETAMKKRFGWSESSDMIRRYTSLTDEDADNSYREALGLGTKKKDIAINPIAKRCSKCGKLIDTGEYCPQCAEIQRLSEANMKATIKNQELIQEVETMKAMFREDVLKSMIETGVNELLKQKGVKINDGRIKELIENNL
ncbi:tyrosine-type recombinase/integrase [Candidatus Methanoperedens nitratireducens]|uniref:Tyr recombinase domain-containing protein n=1 Tax=Candidatus Methanoperedens nitratireducens TaxID=1392998 RepID=A0A284VKP5_9EURY|nr:site-specific integrase [Candidatus Methanoperedens nitroreducens]SNQ59802.1 hypothetical protein MNV_1360004 [Candidatus Methanoperedens nitroreducens]